MRGEDIEERLLEFAVRVGKAVSALPNTPLGRHITGQFVRSGTSPAPNYAEACAAESKKDFIHKLVVALKELGESSVRIRMIVKSELIPEQRLELLRVRTALQDHRQIARHSQSETNGTQQ